MEHFIFPYSKYYLVSCRSSHNRNKAKMRFLTVNHSVSLQVQRYIFFLTWQKNFQFNYFEHWYCIDLQVLVMKLIGKFRFRRVGNPLSHSPHLFQIFKESVRKYSVRAYQVGLVGWQVLFYILNIPSWPYFTFYLARLSSVFYRKNKKRLDSTSILSQISQSGLWQISIYFGQIDRTACGGEKIRYCGCFW